MTSILASHLFLQKYQKITSLQTALKKREFVKKVLTSRKTCDKITALSDNNVIERGTKCDC